MYILYSYVNPFIVNAAPEMKNVINKIQRASTLSCLS